jgi:hypothetical protein
MQQPVDDANPIETSEAPAAETPKGLASALAGGALVAVLTIAAYAYLTWFEGSGETSARMWAPVALLYNIGGKWLVVGAGAALSLAATVKELLAYRSNTR